MRRETQALGVGRVTGEMPAGIGGLMRRKEATWKTRCRWEKVLEWILNSNGKGHNNDRDKWQAVVGAVMNCRVSSNARKCLTS
jgi:hypothetical protein